MRWSRRTGSLVLAFAVLLTGFVAGSPSTLANAPGRQMHQFSDPLEHGLATRVIRLQNAGPENGTLIATFEHWVNNADGTWPDKPVPYVIKRSTDEGRTWNTLTTVEDGEAGQGRPWAIKWTPTLLELPRDIGGYAAGTLFLVGAVTGPRAASPRIEFQLWHSADHGRTWTYGGIIQKNSPDGRALFEPFLVVGPGNELITYFADERDPAHSQKISRIVSTDGGRTWSAPVDVVADPNRAMRPGMPTVTRLPDGRYLMAYELVGAPVAAEARVKVSADGLNWGDPAALGTRPESSDHRYLASFPYLTWSPGGGPHGQLLLSGGYTFDSRTRKISPENRQTVLVSYDLGTTWERLHQPFKPAECLPPGANYALWGASLLPSVDGSRLRLSSPAGRPGSVYCGIFTGEANVGTLPYRSNFSGADDGEAGWVTYSAGSCWSIRAGTYTETCAGPGGDKTMAGSTGWRNYTTSVDVQVTAAGTDAGLVFRATDPAVGIDALRGYYAGIDSSDGTLFLGRQNYNWTALKRVPVPGGVTVGQWYRLAVTASGATITVQVKSSAGTVLAGFTTTDPTFGAGMVGLRTFEGTAAFRDLAVDEISLPSGVYRIRSEVGGYDLDVTDCKTQDGADVRVWVRIAGSPCQRWQVAATATPNTYTITDNNSKKVLDVVGCSPAAGAFVHLWPRGDGQACRQTWQITALAGGAYSIIRTDSGGKSLDVAGCSAAAGADIILWRYHGGTCQRWYLDPN